MANEHQGFVWRARCILVVVLASCGGDLSSSADGSPCADGSCEAGPGDGDAGSGADADAVSCDLPCGTECCETGQACVRDLCIAEVSCAGGEPCQGDSYCESGLCVPFGPPFSDYDEGCAREIPPLDSFEPEIQCEWPGELDIDAPSSTHVLVPPLVADLEDDGVPEIVVPTCLWPDHGTTLVRAIRGDTCEPVWTSEHSQGCSQTLAIADLDGDGRLEICGRGRDYVPYCLSSDGALFWEARDGVGGRTPVDSWSEWGTSLAIADIDGSGSPEVVVGLSVFDGLTGVLVHGRASPGSGLWSTWGLTWALVDIDGDGGVEALTGGWVVDLDTEDPAVDWHTDHGETAVAELSAEHEGTEVVVVSRGSSRVRVHASDGTLIFDQAVPGNSGGPPTVADLDGDGQAEFAAAGHSFLTAYDLDCVGTSDEPPDPARCRAPDGRMDGIVWSVATHEFTSGFTGSSVFDFEGDGPVELVYADECWARVFDGATGAVKFSAPHESGTVAEYPVVADVDGDFFTEIVVPNHPYPEGACPAQDPLMPASVREPGRSYAGITVYRDRTDRWAPSRPLWTQHTEHYSQRNDDGTVPTVELPSWESHNSYRQAHPPQGVEAYFIPDLTVGGLEAPACDSEAREQPLAARVCNRGTLPAAAGVAVSFRLDSPDGAELCAAATTGVLQGGDCEDVGCTWSGVPLEETHAVFAVVDPDDGEGVVECHEDNNLATDEVRCPPPIR